MYFQEIMGAINDIDGKNVIPLPLKFNASLKGEEGIMEIHRI